MNLGDNKSRAERSQNESCLVQPEYFVWYFQKSGWKIFYLYLIVIKKNNYDGSD